MSDSLLILSTVIESHNGMAFVITVRGRRADRTLRLIEFDSAEEQLMPNGSRA